MRLTNVGLGIGTTNPDAALTVSGDLSASRFRVSGNAAAPGYTFNGLTTVGFYGYSADAIGFAASGASMGAFSPSVFRAGVDNAASLGTASIRWTLVYAASRSEEHTSELQSLMRISYAVFCLK